ncbi:MAG: protein BatD [Gemmatimonadetes bacterium]|nr:protein BatD [Gemmatimonadota bacterium]MYH17930.1 protein BatD [Gemmatimonadota bacterium]MYK97895.1 protein BatD [Gemmatimonadota bacterium]
MKRCMQTGLIVLLLFGARAVPGQEVSVTAEVSRTRMTIDETLILTVSVSGSELGDVPKPVLPDMQPFIVIGSTSSSSSSFNLVNGKLSSSRSVRFIYQLKPRRTGTFVIDAAGVTLDGVAHETTPITIEVTPGASGSSQPGASRAAPTGGSPSSAAGQSSTAGQSSATGSSQDAAATPDLENTVYIRTNLDKRRAYLGEQVTVTYTLYTRLGLSNARYDVVPTYTGFWMEELFSAHHLDFKEEIIGGRRYAVATLRTIALFPTVTGELTLEPLSMICDVQAERSRRSLFDSFLSDPFDTFFSNTRQIRVVSGEQTVRVLPLPGEGRPDGFRNAVGDFSLKAMVDQATTEVNQPVTLTIELTGEGNLKTVEDPELPPLGDFKEYQSGNRAEYASGRLRISGTKTWDHVLIPTVPGDHTIASLAFPFFDPDTDAYRVTTTEPITISVLPASGTQAAVVGMPRRSVVRQIREDIHYIKPETVYLGDQGEVLFRSTWYLLLHGLPVVAILATVLYRSHAHRLRRDAGFARRRRARNTAIGLLRRSREQLEQSALDQAFTGISNALYGYVADRCNLPTAGLTSPRVVELLRERGVDEDTAALVRDCLDACDLARFAPTAHTAEHAGDLHDKARKGIESIESQLSRDR